MVNLENAARKEGRSHHAESADLGEFDGLHPGRRVVFESLQSPYSKHLKKKLSFTAAVLDNHSSFHTVCAVYIVPKGKEKSWCASSSPPFQFINDAGCTRLWKDSGLSADNVKQAELS